MSEKQQINGLLINVGAPTRPNLNDDIRMEAARETAADIAKSCGPEWQDIDGIAEDIARHARSYMDGYELARDLDNYAGWDCNFDMCECLDGHSSRLGRAFERHQKAWADAHGVEPAYSDGTRVCISRSEAGAVDGVDKYGPARYRIKMDDGPDNSWRIVNFEDAVLEEATAEAAQ